MVTLSQYLQQKMSEQSVNITQLAKKSGLPRTTVHNIVKYSCYYPKFYTVVPILKTLGITLQDLENNEVKIG